jgi:transposase
MKHLEHDEICEKYNAVFVGDYSCPNCDEEATGDEDEKYIIEKIKYPKIVNKRIFLRAYKEHVTWSEVHCCQKCNTMFWFNNR